MAFKLVPADAHVLEPKHIWDEWLPEKYADKAPKLAKDADGGDGWLFAGSSPTATALPTGTASASTT